VPAALLQRRPDIAAAQRRIAQSNALIGVAKAAYFPSLDLSAVAGFESAQQAALLTAPSLFWTIGPSVLLTIADAGRRKAVEAQAEAVFRESGAKYRATVLHAFQEVEDNHSQLHHLTDESHSLDDAVKDTQHTLDIVMNRYREGVASYLEVVTAQASAEQVQLDELSLRRRRLQVAGCRLVSISFARSAVAGMPPRSPPGNSRLSHPYTNLTHMIWIVSPGGHRVDVVCDQYHSIGSGSYRFDHVHGCGHRQQHPGG